MLNVMNINKNIVDQRIQKIISDNPSWFQDLKNDNEKKQVWNSFHVSCFKVIGATFIFCKNTAFGV